MAADKKKGVLRRQLVHSAVERSGIAASRIKSDAENSAVHSSNPDEYATGAVEETANTALTRGIDLSKEAGRQVYYRKKAYQGSAEKTGKSSGKNADIPGLDDLVTEAVPKKADQPIHKTKAELFRRKAFLARATAQRESKAAAWETAQSAGEKLREVKEVAQPIPAQNGAEVIRKRRISELHRNFIKKQAVKKHFERKAANQVAGTVLPNYIPKLPEPNKKRAVQGYFAHLAKQVWAKIKAAIEKAVKAAASSVVALLGAGGVVLLLAMVIGAAAAVIGSPMGILFADEINDPRAIPIAEIGRETNSDFAESINEIVNAHPKCDEVDMRYDYEDGHTWASYWPEVLAVFAVNTNLNGDSDVVVIDEAKKQQISKKQKSPLAAG